jgi:hypothetical protein
VKTARTWLAFVSLACIIALQSRPSAHVGSPDVFLDGLAGPYRVLVTIRPPYAIPGVAEVEVLTTSDDVREMHIVPLPLTGEGAQFAPVPDVARRSTDDARLFTGQLWMMTAGAWQVRIAVSGDRGPGQLAVPVPTLPSSTLAMSRGLGTLLADAAARGDQPVVIGVAVLVAGCVASVAVVTDVVARGLDPRQREAA